MRSTLLRPAGFCLLLSLNGCVAPPQTGQIVPPAAASRGIIVAMRPVPAGASEPARALLSGAGSPGGSAGGSPGGSAGGSPGGSEWGFHGPSGYDHIVEFIVRTENGAMISVVQPETGLLRPGEPVTILRGAETRIDALPTSLGSR